MGVNVQLSFLKLGFDADAGSIKLDNDGIRVTRGISANLGIGGLGVYQEAYKIDEQNSALEEGVSANFLIFKKAQTTTSIYDDTGLYFEKIKEETKNKTEITAGASATIGIGFEFVINLEELNHFINNLH